MRSLLQTLVLAACVWLPSRGQLLAPGWGVSPHDSRAPWVKCSADTPTDPAAPGTVSCLSGGGPQHQQQQGYSWQQLPGGLPPLALQHRHHYLSDGRVGCSVERGYRTRLGDSTLRCSAVSEKQPQQPPPPAATWPWGLTAYPLPLWRPCALPPTTMY